MFVEVIARVRAGAVAIDLRTGQGRDERWSGLVHVDDPFGHRIGNPPAPKRAGGDLQTGGESHMASLVRPGLRAPHAPGPRCGGLGRAPRALRRVRGPRAVRRHLGVGCGRSILRQTQGDVVHQGVQKR